jgi:uncharacterized repeat protein (TIGR02543 family)
MRYFRGTTRTGIVYALALLSVALLTPTACVNPVSSKDDVDRDIDGPQAEPADITDPAIGPYDTLPTWTWDSDPVEGTTVFRYRLNSGDWMIMPAGPPPYTYTPATDLYPGTYILEVQERNVAGIWSEASSQTITILVQPPTIPTGPPALTNDPVPAFQWAQGAPLQFGAADRYDWRLEKQDAGEWTFVESESQTAVDAVLDYTVSTALSDGDYRFGVAEWNSGGPRSDFTWHPFTVDATPPNAPVISGPAAVSQADPWSTYTWTYDTVDSLGSFSWELRNAADNVVDSDTMVMVPQASVPSAGVNPPAGTYTLLVTHIDQAGNASPSGTHTIQLEETPGVSYSGTLPTNDPTPTLTVTGLNQPNLTNEFRWIVDDIPESGTFIAPGAMDNPFSRATPSLSHGTHEIRVQQRRTDATFADPSLAVSLNIDLVAPAEPTFTTTPTTPTTDTTPSFTVQGEAETTFVYRVTGTTSIGSTDVTDAGSDGTENITLPTLNPGTNTVWVAMRDAAGNISTENDFTVTVLQTYSVTYNANGATGGSAPANQTKVENTDLTLATNSGGLSRTGYVFVGWNENSTGTDTHYAEGATYSANAPLGLYATWSDAIYVSTIGDAGNSGLFPSAPLNLIQDGIDAAVAEGLSLVKVAGGTYYEPITMKAGISLEGGYDEGFANRSFQTIVRRTSAGSIVSATDASIQNGTYLDGFALVSPSTQANSGVSISGGASPTIRNNIIELSYTGADTNNIIGISINHNYAQSSARILNNDISVYRTNGTNATWSGMGMLVTKVGDTGSEADIVISGNRITIFGNTKRSPGIRFDKIEGDFAITNNTISMFTYEDDGCLYFYDIFSGLITVTNNTLINYGNGYGVWQSNGTQGGTFRVVNNIIGNTAPIAAGTGISFSNGVKEAGSNLLFNLATDFAGAYTDLGGNTTVTTNIFEDVFSSGYDTDFSNGHNTDYHINPSDTTYAYNQGTNTGAASYGSVTTDIDGESRPRGGAYDRGSDER